MELPIGKIAGNFLEVASEQRLNILIHLNEQKINISSMAKKLDATVPEVHRNFARLTKSGLILKNVEGSYRLTTLGKTMIDQIPAIVFISNNEKFFKSHTFGNIQTKFIRTIGSLADSEIISGYVKVTEKWKQIYENGEEFINNILVEASYSPELMGIIEDKLNKKVIINSVFSDSAIVTSERKKSISKINMNKFIEKDTLERRMKKDVKIALIMNEKEAGISFPTHENEVDLSKIMYSSKPEFHEWCYDYFKHVWESSGSFQETNLKT
jgi:predicted transcriptional regulator